MEIIERTFSPMAWHLLVTYPSGSKLEDLKALILSLSVRSVSNSVESPLLDEKEALGCDISIFHFAIGFRRRKSSDWEESEGKCERKREKIRIGREKAI